MKADVIRWHQFSRRSDAVFRSLGREIVISTLSVATLLTATPQTAAAQTSAPRNGEHADREVTVDEVEVTASRVPMPMLQAARIVSVMTREQIKDCPAQSVNDLLKYCASVDVRQRGAFGIQTDISINGGTHDQILILLNGVNISSPHTGHLSADLPVSIDDIERIEILEGAASRVYGTSAFSGAVNIVTKGNVSQRKPFLHPLDETMHGSVAVEGGSFGSFGTNASLSHASFGRLSGGYQHSDGGTPNSQFDKYRSFYQGGTSLMEADVDWQLGMSGMNYGANTFYSGRFPNQYEENRRYQASVGARTRGRVVVAPSLYWIRSSDHYQLIRNTHTGENFHLTDVYGVSVNARTTWMLGTSSVGAEMRNEGILSTSLGRPLDASQYVSIPGEDGQYTHRDNRTNISYFLEHDLLMNSWTVSLGLMANMNTALDYRYRLYPGVDVSYRPNGLWKFFASWNMAQRMPTFTDLYYKSPTQEGNTGLKPEKTRELTIGSSFRSRGIRTDIRLFYRWERSMIDWVMTSADSVNGYTTFHAANFKLDNMGTNVSVVFDLFELMGKQHHLKSLSINYAYIHQRRKDDADIYASCYALDYLRHKLAVRLDAALSRRLSATLTYRWQQRLGNYVKYTPTVNSDGRAGFLASTVNYRPYGLLDLRLQWNHPRYGFYLEANNLTSYRYVDIGNVRQPGFWLMAGAKWKF